MQSLQFLTARRSHECRCTDPNAGCWPPKQEWDALSATVGGRFISPKPTGSPCHEPYFNASVCENIGENYFNSYLRADDAGSMQWENWEDEGQKNCSMYTPKRSICHQGQVPVLGVQVESVSDVQKAIRFATTHNLRVAVKTGGHDDALLMTMTTPNVPPPPPRKEKKRSASSHAFIVRNVPSAVTISYSSTLSTARPNKVFQTL